MLFIAEDGTFYSWEHGNLTAKGRVSCIKEQVLFIAEGGTFYSWEHGNLIAEGRVSCNREQRLLIAEGRTFYSREHGTLQQRAGFSAAGSRCSLLQRIELSTAGSMGIGQRAGDERTYTVS